MSQINIRNLSNENDDGAPDIVGVSTFSATSYFVPPVGTTAQRPENPQEGDLRFNTDFASLEYFKGDTLNWTQIEMTSPDLNGGARGVFCGGRTPSVVDNIDYITIPTLGNAIDFGNLTTAQYSMGAASDRTRVLLAGGRTPSFHQNIDYITISSTGNATDTGSDLLGTYNPAGLSDSTRGVFATSSGPAYHNTIDYTSIQTTGAAVDFGDLTVVRGYGRCLASVSYTHLTLPTKA